MSGQISSVEYVQSPPSDLVEPENIVRPEDEYKDRTDDPIASFIENHGHKLVKDHSGEEVTVVEAMNSCPPFRKLVEAMGEGALALTAAKLPEEKENEIADEESKREEERRDEVDLKK